MSESAWSSFSFSFELEFEFEFEFELCELVDLQLLLEDL